MPKTSYIHSFTKMEQRIENKARNNNHEWRWAKWATHPRTLGDIIEVRDAGHTVWTQLAVADYLKEEQ